MPKPSHDRRSEIEAWWPLILRIASGTTGLAIIVWQTVVENVDRPYLIAGAITMMGFPVAGYIAEKLGQNGRGR